jgi:hypothetical protein
VDLLGVEPRFPLSVLEPSTWSSRLASDRRITGADRSLRQRLHHLLFTEAGNRYCLSRFDSDRSLLSGSRHYPFTPCCWMPRPHARPAVSGYESSLGSESLPFCVETSHFDLDQNVICDVVCCYTAMPVRCRWSTQVTRPMSGLCPSGPRLLPRERHRPRPLVSPDSHNVGLPATSYGRA